MKDIRWTADMTRVLERFKRMGPITKPTIKEEE